MSKRPDGSPEHEIMQVLWESDRPLQPSEIKPLLSFDLAYTSVATVLTRLHAKGMVERSESGRAFAYAPAIAEADLAARRIGEILASTSEPTIALARFVRGLSKRDAKAVRAILDGAER
jgi:predicted transcriptional regulator